MRLARIVVLLWLCAVAPVLAQSWLYEYGDGSGEAIQEVQPTSDGGLIVVGWTSPSPGFREFWVLKLGSNGKVQWQRSYGDDANDDAGYSLSEGNDGYWVVGTGNSFGGFFDDIWALKLDVEGNIVHEKVYSETDQGYAIRATTDGGAVVAGTRFNFTTGNDAVVIKIDAAGEVEWDLAWGGPGTGNDDARDVRVTADGGYIVTGATSEYGAGQSDLLVLKLDASGAVEWQRTYGGLEGDDGRSVGQMADGGYIVAGRSGSPITALWILRLDPLGEIQWHRGYTSYQNWSQSIIPTADGGAALAASRRACGACSYDPLLVKLDALGNVEWSRIYDSGYAGQAYSVTQDPDGTLLLAGSSAAANASDHDAFVARVSLDGTVDGACLSDVVLDETVVDAVAGIPPDSVLPSDISAAATVATVVNTAAPTEIVCAPAAIPAGDRASFFALMLGLLAALAVLRSLR